VPLLDVARVMSVAADLRTQAGLTTPPYSAKQLIETCFPDILVTGAPLPKGIHEMVTVDEGGRRTIFYNRRISTAAHRVGIVHGLGHLIFDLSHPDRHCSMDFRRDRHLSADEVRADLFAGEILVPFIDLDRALGDLALFPSDPAEKRHFHDMLDHAASTFKVPPQFIRHRARDLQHLRRSSFFTP